MARISYGRYLDNVNHCCIISSTDVDFVEDAYADEVFQAPLLKMSVLDSGGKDFSCIFYPNESGQNRPDFVKNWIPISQNKLPEWRLAGVNVSVEGTYLIYVNNFTPVNSDDFLDDCMVCVLPDKYLSLLFEMDCNNGLPTVRHEIDFDSLQTSTYEIVTKITVTKLLGKQKLRKIEIQSDNHGKPLLAGKQYAIITEY